MNDREIMQRALEAMMDAMQVSGGISDKMFESVNAISERLAQPGPRNQCGETCERAKLCAVCLAEMGTQPDPLQRLTDVQQEIEAALAPERELPWLRAIDEAMIVHHIGVADPADDYETAKRKVNNLLCHAQDIGAYFAKQAEPEQKPVAGVVIREGLPTLLQDRYIKSTDQRLYTAPQQREWQGLTDEEIYECEKVGAIHYQRHKCSVRGQQLTPADDPQWHFAGAIEAKLKEKND